MKLYHWILMGLITRHTFSFMTRLMEIRGLWIIILCIENNRYFYWLMLHLICIYVLIILDLEFSFYCYDNVNNLPLGNRHICSHRMEHMTEMSPMAQFTYNLHYMSLKFNICHYILNMLFKLSWLVNYTSLRDVTPNTFLIYLCYHFYQEDTLREHLSRYLICLNIFCSASWFLFCQWLL